MFCAHIEWMALVGLCHDAGKIIGLWGQPQWATVGDTFPVGAAMAKEHVFSEFYDENPDAHDDRYNSQYGIYEPNCGLDNLLMSYGHDGITVIFNASLTNAQFVILCVSGHSL